MCTGRKAGSLSWGLLVGREAGEGLPSRRAICVEWIILDVGEMYGKAVSKSREAEVEVKVMWTRLSPPFPRVFLARLARAGGISGRWHLRPAKRRFAPSTH